MPHRNGDPRHTREAIASIASSETLVEVLLQDGLSDADPMTAVRDYAHVVRFDRRADSGQAGALNTALGRASGDIIGWLNADDLYAPGALDLVADAFAQHPHVDVVYGDWGLVDSEGRPLRSYKVATWDVHRIWKKGCYVFSGATFIRRQALVGVGGFDERLQYCMDLDLFLRLGSAGARTEYLPHQLGVLRIHRGSKTGQTARGFAEEALAIRLLTAGPGKSYAKALKIYVTTLASLRVQHIRFSRIYSRFRSHKEL